MKPVYKQISEPERSQLRQFVQITHEMSRSRFIQSIRNEDQSISFEKLEDGATKTNAPDYDWEDFKSLMTNFRKVALAKREPVYLTKISNVISKYAGNELQEFLRQHKKRVIVPIIEGKVEGMRFSNKHMLEGTSLTSYDLLNALVNGRIFHLDDSHQATIDIMDASPPWTYFWIIIREIIIPVFSICVRLANIIRDEGYLAEEDLPESII